MDNLRTFLVVNPRSGNGSVERRWGEIASTVREAFGSYEHAFTTGPEDATRIARRALEDGFELVVALGGDGTLNEVVNGFFDAAGAPVNPGAALGVIPVGTGGDFRKTLGLPNDIRAAAAALRGRAVLQADVGRLSLVDGQGQPRTRHFMNIASFGIGGLVDHIVNTTSKALGGRLSFFLATARAAIAYRNQPVRLSFDGEAPIELRINNVAVANGQYFGGGMHIAPKARLDDGFFDVVAIGDLSALDLALKMRHVYAGTHLDMPKVLYRRARHVKAEPVDPAAKVLLDVDGEQPGAIPSIFELLPGAVRVKIAE
ncbi:MAG TPA: diacylglycerol kinase family protein [Polyangia bacterium]|jgi:YegS/Rv2252/BmrU family lipid kinase